MTEDGEIYAVTVDQQNEIVGFCSCKDDEIMGLYVDPDRARCVMGSDLLRGAEREIAAAGYDRIRCSASLTGQLFYESRGYRVVRRKGWKTRGGLVIDVLDMEKALL